MDVTSVWSVFITLSSKANETHSSRLASFNSFFSMLISEMFSSFSNPRRLSMTESNCSTFLALSATEKIRVMDSSCPFEIMDGRTVHSKKWVGLTWACAMRFTKVDFPDFTGPTTNIRKDPPSNSETRLFSFWVDLQTASKSFIPLTDSRVDINSLDLLFSIFKNILSSDEDIDSPINEI